MAGLLDFLNGEDAQLGLALLAAGGPSAQPMSFGQRLAGGVAQAQGMRDAREDRRFKQQLMQSQMAENAGQAELRQAQIAEMQRKSGALAAFVDRLQGRGPTTGAGGGGGLIGSAPASGGGMVQNMTPDDVLAARIAGLPDITPLWQATRPEMVEVAPGMWADKKTIQPGINQQALAARTADRIEQSNIGMRGDFVDVEDATGRKWNVPKSSLVGGPAPSPAPSLPGRPLGAPGPVSAGLPQAQPGMSGAFMAGPDGKVDADRAMTAIQSIGDPQEKANALSGLQRQIAAESSGAPAVARPSPPMIGPGAGMPAGAIPSGMSRAESDAADVAKLKATEQVKADTVPKAEKQKALNAGNDALRTIDKALNHPGIKEATGLQGTLDPRNYVPGTDAWNFAQVRNQLQGRPSCMRTTA